MINRQGVMGAWVVLSLMFGSAHAAPEKVAPTKSSLPSARETVEATADGSGATPAAALTRALANAVQQVTGVATKQLGDVETSLNTLAVVKSNGDIAVANWAAESTGNTLSFSRGSVKSYRVLSEQAVGKGWRVRVRAAVLKAGGADAVREAMPRLAIVVTQAQAADVAFANLGNRNTVIKRFRARLQQSLLQSGAVRVLDRDNFSAQADELSIAGANPTAENLAKLGQRFSADYVVVIDAQRLRLIDRGRDIYGAHLSKLEAELQADIRIIDVATSELMKTRDCALGHTDCLGRRSGCCPARRRRCQSCRTDRWRYRQGRQPDRQGSRAADGASLFAQIDPDPGLTGKPAEQAGPAHGATQPQRGSCRSLLWR
jgi:hypothetical protein